MYDTHVSGHACQEEQKLMLTLAHPQFFLPVHGEFKQLKRHAETAEHLGVDLAELDPASADLDLVIGATLEQQALGLEAHQVARAVGPLPAQRGQRRVLLGVLGGVQVAGEADAGDDQFAGLALADGRAVGVRAGVDARAL